MREALPTGNAFQRLLGLAAVATVAVLLIAAPSPARAADPTEAQYGNTVTQVAGGTGGGVTETPAPQPSSGLEKNVVGGLPFTGLDVLALAAVAVALGTIGLVLRRLTAERDVA